MRSDSQYLTKNNSVMSVELLQLLLSRLQSYGSMTHTHTHTFKILETQPHKYNKCVR